MANVNGNTALDAAGALEYQSVIEFLIENGAVEGAGADSLRGRRFFR